jgi:hypothetical protein
VTSFQRYSAYTLKKYIDNSTQYKEEYPPEELNRETDKMAVEFHRAQVGEWRFDHRNKTIQ